MATKADTWMPFYVADYLRDTMHLTTELHGAYLLLLMAAWTRGGRLPTDDLQLSGIAKMAPSQWRKVKPVLLSFFTIDGADMFQKRAVHEAEKAQRLSDIRRETGSRGGRPPKTKPETKTESPAEPIGLANRNQTRSQTETPSPPPPPSGGLGDASASLSDVPDGTSSPERSSRPRKRKVDSGLVERLWGYQPVTGGKRKATRPEVEKALTAALDRGGGSNEIEAAFRAYYALPDCTRDEGRFAKGAAVLLHDDKWRDFVPDEGSSSTRPWPGPADLRAAVVAETSEEFARSYLDPCGWRNGPDRVVTSPNNFRITELRKAADHVLKRFNAKAIVEPPGVTQTAKTETQ